MAHCEKWWLTERLGGSYVVIGGGSLGDVVAHCEMWLLIVRSGGSL